MIRLARAGIYGDRSVRGVPQEYASYIVLGAGGFTIHPDAKQLVRVDHLNLHDDKHMSTMRAYDFIFCRNVLIYFDDDSRRKVLDHFYEAMSPGGYIFLGHSQSVGRITSKFRLMRIEGHMLYTKD